MLMLASKTLLLAVAVLAAAAAAQEVIVDVELPAAGQQQHQRAPAEANLSGLPRMACSRNAKNRAFVNRCIRNNFQSLLPAIRNGGVLGLPTLEPYHVKSVSTAIKTIPLSFHVDFTNLTVQGLPDAIIRDARSDLRDDGMNMEIDLTFPKLVFKGFFEFTNGIFAMWDFKGRGPAEVVFNNVRATWKVKGIKKAEDKYMTIEHVTPVLSYTVGGLKFWAKGLVDGNPALDDVVNTMVNRLWQEVVEVCKPPLNKPMSEHLTLLANDVFRSVPYEQLFPSSGDEPSSS